MKIAGLQKLTLLDYPTKTACTVFTAGCNFRCPFCHNSDVVYGNTQEISTAELFDFLKSRKGKLDGVCVTGGEPLLHADIVEFLQEIRALGFLIKLDTNGSRFQQLRHIVTNGLCDFVAMDIKNSLDKYNITAGAVVNIEEVKSSIEFLKTQTMVDYEFRTTVVKQLHEESDFKSISALISGAKAYFLQSYKDCDKVIKKGYSAYSEDEMRKILTIVQQNGVPNASLRGL